MVTYYFRFAHYINLEFSLDIITALDKILNEEWLSPRERLHCMQTVFAILSGQGEVLNVDPTHFYNSLYKNLLTFSMSTKDEAVVLDLIRALDTALVKRRKKITNKRTIGFVKRIATLCLQLVHAGSIASLSIINTLTTLNRFTDILMDTDSSVGEGTFLPDVDDPEYCNASNTALYEMVPLRKHYHPLTNAYANHIVRTTDHRNLVGPYTKMYIIKIFKAKVSYISFLGLLSNCMKNLICLRWRLIPQCLYQNLKNPNQS